MALRSLGTLTLDLIAKIAGFESGMDRAARNAEKNFRKMRKEAQDAGDFIGRAMGLITAGAGFAAFIRNTVDAQNEQAQLAAVLRSTGEAAGYSQAELNELADAMARTSTVSAGEISSAQATLLAFTGIVGDEFPRALQAAIDMAARTGTSVVAAAETVGRALDVPSKGLSALSKQGFRFTEDQKKLAERLESVGRTAEAQGIILRALEDTYGGAAKAARDTFGGAMIAAREAFNDLFEAAPGAIDPVTDSLNELTDLLRDPETVKAAQDLGTAIINSMAGAGKAVAVVVQGIEDFAEGLAAAVHGPALDDLERVQERLDNLTAARNRNFVSRLFDGWSDEELDAEIALLSKALEDAYNRNPLPAPKLVSGEDTESEAKRAGAAIADVAGRTKRELEAAERAEAARLKSISDTVAALEKQAITVGMTADQIKRYELFSLGATEADIARARASQQIVKDYEDQKAALEAVQKSADDNFAEWESSHLDREGERYEKLLGKAGEAFDGVSVYADQAARNMQDAFADFLFDPFDDGLEGMAISFAKTLQRMLAEAAAAEIFKTIGAAASGSDSGWLQALGAAISGTRASGGPTAPGSLYQVNELGPELYVERGRTYLMTGDSSGQVVPLAQAGGGGMAGGGGINLTTNVVVNSEGARSTTQGSDERSARQLAAMIEEQTRAVIARETRQGGIIWNLQAGYAR